MHQYVAPDYTGGPAKRRSHWPRWALDVLHALAFGIIASALALAIMGIIAAAFLAALVLA